MLKYLPSYSCDKFMLWFLLHLVQWWRTLSGQKHQNSVTLFPPTFGTHRSKTARASPPQHFCQGGATEKPGGCQCQDANLLEIGTYRTREEDSCLWWYNDIGAKQDLRSLLTEVGTFIDNYKFPNHYLPAFQEAQEECRPSQSNSVKAGKNVLIWTSHCVHQSRLVLPPGRVRLGTPWTESSPCDAPSTWPRGRLSVCNCGGLDSRWNHFY